MKASSSERRAALAGGIALVLSLFGCAGSAPSTRVVASESKDRIALAPSPTKRSSGYVLERVSVDRELSLELPAGRRFAFSPPRGAFTCLKNEQLGVEVCARQARIAKSEKLEGCERGLERSLGMLRDAPERAIEARLDRPLGFFGRASMRVGRQGERLVTHFALDAGVCLGTVIAISPGENADELAAVLFEKSLPTIERARIDDRVTPVDP